jgi:hypothetical protein
MDGSRDEYVTDDTKNGLITAVGIILAGTLVFLGPWALSPEAFVESDALPGALFAVGTTSNIAALIRALLPHRLPVHFYHWAVGLFVFGTGTTALGILVAVTVP